MTNHTDQTTDQSPHSYIYDAPQLIVDSWFGQYSLGALMWVARNLGYPFSDDDLQYVEPEILAYESIGSRDHVDDRPEPEIAAEIADEIETWINDNHVAPGLVATWSDGDFYVALDCGADDEQDCTGGDDCIHSRY